MSSAPSKAHQKDASWMDETYLSPNREKSVSKDREHSDRYRSWSPSRRNSSSSWSRSDWRYDRNRERYQNRHHRSYYSRPYTYGERQWSRYDGSYMSSSSPHPSERADSQPPAVQSSVSGSEVTINTQGAKPSRLISPGRNNAKNKQIPRRPPELANLSFHSYKFITEHLKNTILGVPQSSAPMLHTHNALINQIIADEAIRMLSCAASSNEPTSLNEPCDETESSTPVATGASIETTPIPLGTATPKPINKASVAADSALLQKSAEQVTRKLINQLTTMSKYNLMQMIDNPAGKYETALNKHAQNKLRAEVRKQLKNFNLAEAVRAKDSTFSSDVMAPDEAIDAEKIPTALLKQIGQALDLDFYGLSSTEPKDGSAESAECPGVVETNDQSVGREIPSTNALSNAEDAPVQSQKQMEKLALILNKPCQSAAKPNPSLVEPTPPAKIISFLRVSTVDELNKRMSLNNEISGEDVTTFNRISQPPVIASDMLPSCDTMEHLETSSPLAERTLRVSPIDGSPSTEPNALVHCSSNAITNSVSLSFVQTNTPINFAPIGISLPVEATGHTQQQKLAINKTPVQRKKKPAKGKANNDKQQCSVEEKAKQDHDPSNATGGSHEMNPPVGKKKSKCSKKSPKKVPDRPPALENGSTITVAGSEQTPIKQSKPTNKKGRRAPVLQFSPKTGNPHIYNRENFTWQNARTECGNGVNEPAEHPSFNGEAKVSRWDKSVAPSTAIAVTNGECNLHTKSPEQVPISSRSPQSAKGSAVQRNRGTGRSRACLPPSKNRSRNSSKRSCGHSPPMEVSTTENVAQELARNQENYVTPQNEMVQDTPMDVAIPNDKEQGYASNIRISNIRSLQDAIPPMESESFSLKEVKSTPLECTVNATADTINEHEEPVLSNARQPSDHADRLGINNTPTTHSLPGEPEMILPDFMSPPQPPLGIVLDQMQSIDSQTMGLFKRKMEIDAKIMKLNGERMEIDQEIVKLQNARDEHMNTLRLALLLPLSAGAMQNSCPSIRISLNPNGDPVQESVLDGTIGEAGSDGQQNTQQPTGCNQERTIRRITKISGNSELMRIFQRRRLLSERSSDENPTTEDGSTFNDLSTS